MRAPAERGQELPFLGTGRFEVLSQLGQGAAGSVYEVLDRVRNTRLALKTLRTTSPEQILLLKNEFRAMQDLSHPNLVSLVELFEEAGRWFFTMEYVPGKDFLSHVRADASVDRDAITARDRAEPPESGVVAPAPVAAKSGGFEESKLRRALAELAKGLSALHRSHK